MNCKGKKNNPPVGLVTPQIDKDEKKKAYAYDPHLDPQLQWAGKEEIKGVLASNGIMLYASMPADALSRKPYEARKEKLIGDLLALLSGKKEPMWCEHIKIRDFIWYFDWKRLDNKLDEEWISDGWKLCPICGAKRPVE